MAVLTQPRTVPYGEWPSPITAERAASAAVGLGEVYVTADDVTWLEQRPDEQGRHVVMRGTSAASAFDVTPEGRSARTRVHEYGGGSYAVSGAGVVFANDDDQRLYRHGSGEDPVPITPDPERRRALRYADLDVSPDGGRVACVRERHPAEGLAVNELVVLPIDGAHEPLVVAAGRDFYAFPRWSPDGERLAFIAWDLPRMPWDGTELHVLDVGSDSSAGAMRRVAGGPTESIFQPSWDPTGRLHFISDRTGWWNLFAAGDDEAAVNRTPVDAEFGVPMWLLGYSTYAFLGDGRIACVYRGGGVHHLGLLEPGSDELLDLDLPYRSFDPYLRANGTRLAFVAGGPRIPLQVATLDVSTNHLEVLRAAEDLELDPAYLSEPEPIAFPTTDDRTAYAFYYPPSNPAAAAPEGERPPLLVHIHGGPTSEVAPELDLERQFFTSRGFAVVDVNYGGSTGFGRAFRESLYGRWGVVDVDDAIAAAGSLVERGLADPDRLVISGGSAGGWTTLCALTFRDVFATGANYFGVSDLEPFATFTHKFELRYNDQLVGPLPEASELWAERSPVRHADRLSRPVLILQGDEDEVVPPSQSELIVDALARRGVPYAYLLFEGEQHGFRKAENVARALEAELTFYGRILGFDPADDLPPLDIQNLGD